MTILLLPVMVLTRIALLRRRGVTAMKFGETDKTDFFIPPFVLFYVYLIFANAFAWPTPVHTRLLPAIASWIGVLCCAAGVMLMGWSLASFGTSFRVGIDADRPDKLITSGAFAITRNPIYVAFGLVLAGEFLIQPTWLMLVYLVAGVALFHRQVLREEAFMTAHYGPEFRAYAARVRRYV
ncbi:MAG TPA: isoprenylcysteine carboxylmethyltransferase family protein [Verrucomicrobiae bacterium]|nr:isoprenylcysteine carboxylmethyltransferase family protein [Verrucomicrobiae bacterium]